MSDNTYNNTIEETIRSYQTAFEKSCSLLDHAAIQKRAQQLEDIGLHFVVIPPTTEYVEDTNGKKHCYQAIGKKPKYKYWPAGAWMPPEEPGDQETAFTPEEIPERCNLGILCGTPVTRNDKTYFVADVDIDVASAVPIFERTYDSFDLPQPQIWGRPGKPRSHRLYLIDKPLFTEQSYGIAELRCQTKTGEYAPYGNQSVTFPSVWCKNGNVELITEEPDSATEPPLVSAEVLLKAFRTSIAVCLLAPLLPEHKRDLRMGFFRVAAQTGMHIDDAVRFMTLVDFFCPFPKNAPAQFATEAKELYSLTEEGSKHNLYGTPTIIKNIGEQHAGTLEHVYELLGFKTVSPGPAVPGKPKHGYELTDTGNGQRFADKYKEEARYCPEDKGWYVWDGRRWAMDRNNRVQELAKTLSGDIKNEARLMKLEGTATKEEQAEFAKNQKDVSSWATRSAMTERLSAATKNASSIPEVIITRDQFDTHANLLNCPNGIVDLYKGDLLKHDRTFFLTQLCPIEFDPQAASEQWSDVLATIFTNHTDMIECLQIFCGYVAQANKTEEKIVITYGEGGTGKGTFWTLISKALGPDYVRNVSPNTLLRRDRSGSGASGDIARLEGCRLALTSEFERGSKLQENFLKMASGNDSITARKLYTDDREFRPAFQLVMMTNRRPEFDASDTGNLRRYWEFPFDYKIPKDKLDPGLKQRLIDSQTVLKAVLAWIVAGCVKWKLTGLIAPTCVLDATKELFRQNDSLGEFTADCLVMDAASSTTVYDMRQTYKRWCIDNNLDIMKTHDFNDLLKDRGLKYGQKKDDKANVKTWFGAKLIGQAMKKTITDEENGEFVKSAWATHHNR